MPNSINMALAEAAFVGAGLVVGVGADQYADIRGALVTASLPDALEKPHLAPPMNPTPAMRALTRY
jgi:hypothetical protein